MAVVILVSHNGFAVFRDGRPHEFADDAAEICGHQERFEAFDFLCVQLCVNKTQEIEEILHGFLNVRYRHSKRNLTLSIEAF